MLKETVHIAVPTAFFGDESLNIQATMSHIRELYKQGVKSVLVSGSTGEQHSLYLREKIEILNAIEQEKELISNMEIIFGLASVRQKEAEELAQKIRQTKISGILLGYPPYVIPTQEEAIVYTKRIIQLCNKPTILYNNPKRTGFDLSEKSIIQLSEIDLVIGIKEAGNEEKVGRIKNAMHRDEFYFYAGGEVNVKEKVVLQGYNRLSSIAGNVSPKEICQWFQKILMKQNVSEQESEKIENIMEQVYQGNPIVNVKKIINRKGVPMGICRSPIGSIVPD